MISRVRVRVRVRAMAMAMDMAEHQGPLCVRKAAEQIEQKTEREREDKRRMNEWKRMAREKGCELIHAYL